MRFIPSFLRSLCIVTLAFLIAPVAVGQIPQGQQGQAQQAPDVSDEQIEAAARIYVAIQELRTQYQQEHGKLQEMDSTQARRVQKEFRGEVDSLLQDEDALNQKSYGQVVQAAQQDTTVRNKFVSRVKAEGGNPPNISSPPDLSQQQISAVADVYVKIQQMRQELIKKHGNPQQMDSTQTKKVQREFGQMTQKIFQASDVSQQTFMQVIQTARKDPQVRKQLLQAIKQAGGSIPTPQKRPSPGQGGQPAPGSGAPVR